MPPVDRRLRRLPVVLVSLLVVAACGSQTATPPPSPTSPPTAPPTAPASAPASQAPTPSASAADPNAALYTEIEAQVRELRGLDATATVERSVLDEAGLRDYITTSFAKDNPEPLIAGTEGLLKGLGLLPEADSLRDLYIELLTSQVAGLYDDDTKQMYVVSRTGEIGPAEQVTYAHEYDHALQDQHFGLSSLVGEAKDQGDRTLARTALAEGDATLLMSLWAQQHLAPAELADLGSSVDPASQAVLDRMPPILRDTLTFPYTGGLSYLLGDFAAGGWDAVNAQWSTPPVSTEQVLHADKRSEPPVAVSFPDDLASRLGSGWSVAIQDTLGEYQLGILLDDVGDVGQAASADAAAGWGGDRVALLVGPGAASAVVLESAWDSAKDADQFRAAADDVVGKLKAGGRSAAVLAPSGKRVVLISAGDADTLARVANVLGLAG